MNKILYKKNEYIFREGDESDHIYIIDSGKVKIFKVKQHKEKILAVLGPGELFGEIGVLSKSKRSANAFTLEDTVLEIIKEEEISDILEKNLTLNLIIQTLIKRIKNLDGKINLISFLHEEFRLCFYFGVKYMEDKKTVFDIDEIAYFTDIEEEKISYFLDNLEQKGIVNRREDKYVIIRKPELIFEHTKYLFLEEKFRRKEKLKEKFYPLL
ncbi:MAG: cyclic nucleotide-binding domain-containing protein [candidate division WOR-3 bacterium]